MNANGMIESERRFADERYMDSEVRLKLEQQMINQLLWPPLPPPL